MFFSFQKRRSAAPRLAKSRVRASRRLLVEGLEERRVMDAGGLIAVHNFVQDDSEFTTAENVVLPVDFGTTNDETAVSAQWYIFLDDGENAASFIFPNNGSADILVGDDFVGDDVDNIIDSLLLTLPASDPFTTFAVPVDPAPNAGEPNMSLSLNIPASAIYAALPQGSTDTHFIAVVRYSAQDSTERYEWFAQSFSIDPDVGSLAVDPIDGPANAIIGQSLEFTSGVSGTETAAEDLVHTWTVTNQQTSVVVGQGTSASLNFTPTTAGTYVVSYSVNDGNIDASAEPVLLSVAASSFVNGQLALGTAAAGGSVIVGKSGASTTVNVGGVTTNYTGVQGITIYGQAGNDVVIIGSNVTSPVTVFGGAGNDIITGGSGADILVGGAGTDAILGGAGRDLIIGGDGTDILIGNADDDVIIGGYTNRDAEQLAAILATWNGAGTFAQRVATLRVADLNQSTVFDDDDMDLLSGNAGADWFFANLVNDNQPNDRKDLILDRTAAEFAQYQELINEVNP